MPPICRRPSSDSHSSSDSDAEMRKVEHWLLEHNIPVISGWMQSRVLTALLESVQRGNAHAAQSLATILANTKNEEERALAGNALRNVNFSSGIDAAWSVWMTTRNVYLEEILMEKNRTATHPASVRLFSALKLNDMDTVTRGSADLMNALIVACQDVDPTLAERAFYGITHLGNPASIDAVCRVWVDQRLPFLANVIQEAGYVAQKPPHVRALSALKGDHADIVLRATPGMVAPLVDACDDGDKTIALRAREYLLHLKNQPAIDVFCQLWCETRRPLLEAILMQASYSANLPLSVRLLTALKTGHLSIAQDTSPEGLLTLLSAVQDIDSTLSIHARMALETLTRQDLRDALCAIAISPQPSNPNLALEIVQKAGYVPENAEQRALFWFLTGQWRQYDDLDFDNSLMRTYYETGSPELRQRIAAQVQSAGRTAYLSILTGMEVDSRNFQVTQTEAALMVRILIENHEWDRLWRLAPALTPSQSQSVIRALSQTSWQPEDELDRPVFAELATLAQKPMTLEEIKVGALFPPALACAQLRVRGRVNEVAFSPIAPLLAIATSHRKVVLWNYQTGSVHKVIKGFQHSVGKVHYTPQGTLICAERTNTRALCTLYVYPEGEPAYQLCNHEGSITVVASVGRDRLLTAGRDTRLIYWDMQNRKLIKETRLHDTWARNAAVSPDGQSFALLSERLEFFRLPELRGVPGQPYVMPAYGGYKRGVAQHVTFSPDGKFILTGQRNGQVALYFHNSLLQFPHHPVITQHPLAVQAVHFLPDHPIVVTAGAEGQIRFIHWQELTQLGVVKTETTPLTSLHISQNGDFMATGAQEGSLRLWDLRLLDIPDLITQPLALATHDQVSTVFALSGYKALPEDIQNTLQFMRVLLQYRFRFDIQIEEAPTLQVGEFDILLEDGN